MLVRKMHVLGNDFVVFDARKDTLPWNPDTVRAIADRRRGLGCDQVLVRYEAPNRHAGMSVYNSDGTEAKACGNGAACIAKLLLEETGLDNVSIQCHNRLISGHYGGAAHDQITLDMGTARLGTLTPQHFTSDDFGVFASLTQLRLVHRFSFIEMGNSHLVILVQTSFSRNAVSDLMETSIIKQVSELLDINIVAMMQHWKTAPNTPIDNFYVEVLERGSGRTPSCGTGACAAVASVCYDTERAGLNISPGATRFHITQPGGISTVDCEGKNDSLYITGQKIIDWGLADKFY